MRILEFQRRAECRGWHDLIRQNCIPNVLYKTHGAHTWEREKDFALCSRIALASIMTCCSNLVPKRTC